MKKRLLLLTLFLIALTCLVGIFSACKVSNEDYVGTYYLYKDGELDLSDYIKLEKSAWSNSNGESGTLQKKDVLIELYTNESGLDILYGQGTVSGGILKLSLFDNRNVVYCKQGKKPTADNLDPTKYTVVFDLNGGNGSLNSMQFSNGEVMSSLPTPERTDYTFVCWEDDEGEQYTTSSVMPAKNLSLTAVWEINEMANLLFTSTPTTVEIVGVKDNTVTSISVPDYVTSIAAYAFSDCTSLTSITIPASVTSIGDNAFYGCSKLTSITIPESVTSIGSSAFSGCSSLQEITLPFVGGSADATTASSSTLFGYIFGTSSYEGGTGTQQYDYLFESYSIYYIPTSLKSVTITGGDILYGAFYNCSALISITIPASVTSIGSGAFRGCTSLTSITVDEGNEYYKSIDGNMYSKDGTTLVQYAIGKTETTFVIPSSVTSIGNYAFFNCSSLTTVTFAENSQCTSIGYQAFSYCSSLTSITIPASVTSIDQYAFCGCISLTSVTFKNTSGWWYSSSSYATSGTSISSSSLANTSTAATYLTSTFYSYYWKRS